MDDLRSELNELKQFIGDLKADRAATKEKERRESWTRYVSLTVVVIAVIASIAAQWSGKYGSRSQMNQAKASDAWSAFQSQSIKEHIYDVTRKQLPKGATDAELAQQKKEFDETVDDYKNKKADWQHKAEGFEAAQGEASRKGGYMGTSISFLSIAIAMTSTCLLTKKKPLWLLSILLALVGVGEMIYAWCL